ncbi:hypothetical protein KEM52_004295 [Ascosphaera acerosa]|nr:hypothetical protein KEM52_004295 [Ascosphaera acerosa]
MTQASETGTPVQANQTGGNVTVVATAPSQSTEAGLLLSAAQQAARDKGKRRGVEGDTEKAAGAAFANTASQPTLAGSTGSASAHHQRPLTVIMEHPGSSQPPDPIQLNGDLAASDSVDGSDDDEDEEEPPKVLEVRLIDFAHAAWTPGQGPDENVLHGLRNVAGFFEAIAQEGPAATPATTSRQ